VRAWLNKLGVSEQPDEAPKAACCSVHAGGYEECYTAELEQMFNKKGERKMTEEKTQYRSSIDELVCKSGLPGSVIAREMGISVNRIIALRRARSENISTDDLSACKAAIVRLGGDVGYDQDGELARVENTCCTCRALEALSAAVAQHEQKLLEIINRLEKLAKGSNICLTT